MERDRCLHRPLAHRLLALFQTLSELQTGRELTFLSLLPPCVLTFRTRPRLWRRACLTKFFGGWAMQQRLSFCSVPSARNFTRSTRHFISTSALSSCSSCSVFPYSFFTHFPFQRSTGTRNFSPQPSATP